MEVDELQQVQPAETRQAIDQADELAGIEAELRSLAA